jgi:anti-sigma B factor antagonist
VKPASDERTPDGGAHHTFPPPHEQLLTLRTVERHDAVVVTAAGAIDGLTAPRLAAAVDAAYDSLAERVLIVDLAEIGFLGSAGLRVLRDAASEAVNRRGLDQLRVVVDHSRPVIRPIEIVGFDQFLTLFHTVEDALMAGEPS